MSDKEDSTAALGHCEELSVKRSPCEMIPDTIQRPDECPEVPSCRSGKSSRDVFPQEPSGLNLCHKSYKVHGQSAADVGKSASFSGDGEALARSPPDQKVNCSTVFSPVYLCHVPDVRNIREVVRED